MDSGMKFDNDKPQWSLLPLREVEQIVKVLTFGAKKYSPDNWKRVEADRYFDAMMRHIVAWKTGEMNDSETDLNHLAHAACNALFLLYFDEQKNDQVG